MKTIIKRQSAFTLVEMLISVSILAMVLTLSYQAFGIYLKSFGSTKSLVSESELAISTDLKLRYSIAAMSDYYVKENDEKVKLYFKHSEDSIEYVSTYSILGFNADVVTQIAYLRDESSSSLRVKECPLNKLLLLSYEGISESENCKVTDVLSGVESLSIAVEEQKTILTFNDTLEEYEQSEAMHLLPKNITLSYSVNGIKGELYAATKIRNIVKLKRYVVDHHKVDI